MNLKEMWESNDGPIPGENYTSDTKNYPWHRKPEITDLDDAIDFFVKKVLGNKKKANGLVTLVEMGVPISTATDIFVTQGIGGGKWTPDFAIMMAGPIARIIEMMVRGAGVKDYVKGWEDEETLPTKTYFELQTRDTKQTSLAKAKREALTAAQEAKENPPTTGLGGLGAKPPQSEDVEEQPDVENDFDEDDMANTGEDI